MLADMFSFTELTAVQCAPLLSSICYYCDCLLPSLHVVFSSVVIVIIWSLFLLCRDTYVKQMAGESPNDRNDRGLLFG